LFLHIFKEELVASTLLVLLQHALQALREFVQLMAFVNYLVLLAAEFEILPEDIGFLLECEIGRFLCLFFSESLFYCK
jgi:hypothetical protein